MTDPLTQTLLAQVYDVAIESPLELATKLSGQLGHTVVLKREDLQPVHSFKIRGAYNKISRLTAAERKRGVIAASAGNHAQGVALSARKLGLSALIVMPTTTPSIKIEAVKSFGATVELSGDNYSEAFEYCQRRIKETGRVFVHPFDDPLVIAGQGTVASEIIEKLPSVTHIFVPIGGGGLIAGVSQYVKALRPDVKIIGVEPNDSSAMKQSVAAGKRITLPHVGIFADGVAVKTVGELTFAIAKKHVDEFISVNNDQICAAIKAIYEETRSIAEPAGALGIAGIMHAKLPKDAVAVAICSGANMTFERLQYVAERTLLGSGKEALFAVHMTEEPGSLLRFCNKVVNGHSITEFNYRLQARGEAKIFVGVSVSDARDKQAFMNKMDKYGYHFVDLSADELAKEHVRHMVGGPAPADKEKLYTVNFPERAGALSNFLTAVGAKWNISLFHYRGQGSDVGKVLIGFEGSDDLVLAELCNSIGYDVEPVSSEAAKLFLE